jgi:hypothetical protein
LGKLALMAERFYNNPFLPLAVNFQNCHRQRLHGLHPLQLSLAYFELTTDARVAETDVAHTRSPVETHK